MSILSGCSSFGEFKVRTCLEQPFPMRAGVFSLKDMLVHHYPYPDEELPTEVKMRLEQCHNTDRLAVTQ